MNSKNIQREKASIEDHLEILKKKNKGRGIIWSISNTNFSRDEIYQVCKKTVHKAYFWDLQKRRITYSADVKRIYKTKDFRKTTLIPRKEKELLPYFRKPDNGGANHGLFILITKFYRLEKPKKLSFFKDSNGESISFVESYRIIIDKRIHGEVTTTYNKNQILHDEIRGRLSEKDLEELYVHSQIGNWKLTERQTLSSEGRLDVKHIDDKRKEITIIEIKKDTAGKAALEQVKRYMNDHRKRSYSIKAVVLASDFDHELIDLVKTEKSISLLKFNLSIDFKKR